MRVVLLALVFACGAGACGDNTAPPEPLMTGTSGTRIKLQWYLYADGSRQLDTSAFYDAELHAACARTTWDDGVARCTPIADPTVFHDPDCTLELGRARSTKTPVYFVSYERSGGELRARHLLRAGAKAETPTAFFERRDGACVAVGEPQAVAYYELPAEIGRGALVEMWSDEIVDDRLGLEVIASTDGLTAPVGLTDRTLGMRCDPQIQPEGHATCVPRVAVAPAHFADPYCEERVVVAAAPPAAVEVLDANGCARHHATADEYTSLLYRRAGATCVRASLGAGERAYRVGAPLELAHLDRTVDAAPRHRLQQITIGTGGLRFVDTQLHDLATRTDCQSYGNGKLAVCVPRTSSLALRLWSNPSCTREALVTELPRVQCTKSVFAVDPDALTIHAIGAVHTAAVFGFDPSGNCRPRPPASDRVTYTLGPAIPPSTFVAGVVYSDR